MKAGEVFLSLKQVSESVYSYKPHCVVPPHLQYYCFHRLSFPSMAMLLNDVLYNVPYIIGVQKRIKSLYSIV